MVASWLGRFKQPLFAVSAAALGLAPHGPTACMRHHPYIKSDQPPGPRPNTQPRPSMWLGQARAVIQPVLWSEAPNRVATKYMEAFTWPDKLAAAVAGTVPAERLEDM